MTRLILNLLHGLIYLALMTVVLYDFVVNGSQPSNFTLFCIIVMSAAQIRIDLESK